MRRFFLLPVLFAAFCIPLSARPERGDYLTVKIAVMGPGDQLYFWWGHIALVIDDALTGESRFFDYGLFSFQAENFFANFALGRLVYSCGVSPAEQNYRGYRMTNRDITVYTLDLPAEKKFEILRFVENNALPENRNYFYHHFKDNCSTRIRDIVDLATNGQFGEAYGEAPGRFTLRQHVRRHTWFSPFFDWFLNFLMGQDIDVPITVWQEMFLPAEAGNRINEFYVTGEDGGQRKLVSGVETLNRAVNRPAVLDAPRRSWPLKLAAGLVITLAVFGLYLLGRNRPAPARVLLGTLNALLGLFFGVMGTLLFFMTFFTNHDYTWHNINVLFTNPLLLAAVPFGVKMALDRGGGPLPGSRRSPAYILGILWTYVFCAGLASLALRALPGFYQQNQPTLVLVLPFSFALGRLPQYWLAARQKKG